MRPRGRRDFLKTSLGSAAVAASVFSRNARAEQQEAPAGPPRIRFAAIGLNHGHIYGQVEAVIRGGGELVSFFAKEPDLIAALRKRHPMRGWPRASARFSTTARSSWSSARRFRRSARRSASRSMRHGKDFMADKPGITTLAQLDEVRKRPGGDQAHLLDPLQRAPREPGDGACRRAGPGRCDRPRRADDRPRAAPPEREDPAGLVLRSRELRRHPLRHRIAPVRSVPVLHRLHRRPTSSPRRWATCTTPQHPGLEDFGDAMVRGNRGTGYVRVDWFTPDGLSTWGDGRVTVLGTDGFIEIRKNVDIGGRPGGNHLFLVDQKETRYIDSADVKLAYGAASGGRRAEPDGDGGVAGGCVSCDGACAAGRGAGGARVESWHEQRVAGAPHGRR